jgi:FkbM family methyltransferase
MPSFRKLYNLDFNSSLIRFILSLFYRPGKYYRIPFGALKGIAIWYDRNINFHAVLGIWEKENFSALEKILPNLIGGDKVIHAYDIGANIGLYSLFLARYSSRIKVIAFEPVQETVINLEKNLKKNNLAEIQLVVKAVGNIDGEVKFYLGHHHKSSLEKDWTSDRGTKQVREVRVPSLKIDSFVAENPEESPDFIKIDVEGGGGKVLDGARHVLQTKRPVILIESHAAYEDQAIVKMLDEFSYQAYRINNSKWVSHPGNDYTDPEGVWGTMILFPAEKSADFFK